MYHTYKDSVLSVRATFALPSSCPPLRAVTPAAPTDCTTSTDSKRRLCPTLSPPNTAQAIHGGLVVDKPAQELQNVLLTELDGINPDHVPLIADAILAPLLTASRQRSDPFVVGRRNQPPPRSMGDAAAAGFLVALDILPKVLGLTAGVPALSEEAPVPEDCRGLSGTQYKASVVSRLLRARWPGAVSIGMCQVLRDLELEEGQLEVAVARVLRHLRKSAKLHDLPPLTYQLLLLAGRYGASTERLPFRRFVLYRG